MGESRGWGVDVADGIAVIVFVEVITGRAVLVVVG
jgi:hypothetical protein